MDIAKGERRIGVVFGEDMRDRVVVPYDPDGALQTFSGQNPFCLRQSLHGIPADSNDLPP